MLDQIGAETGLGAGLLGLLAAVPLLSFAAVSPLAHLAGARFGAERAVFVALLLLVAGTVLRPLPGPMAALWIGTVLVGAAIAVFNVLLPAIIKRDFPERTTQLTGAYSAVLGGVASFGAGLSFPLSQLPLDGRPAGWRFALLAYVVLAVPALVFWWPWLRRARLLRRHGEARHAQAADGGRVLPAEPAGTAPSVWRSATAWQVTAYMGLQSLVFYVLINWLPTVERAYGRTDAGSGWDLMAFQLTGVVASLATPLFLRGRLLRWGPCLPAAVVACAMAGFMLLPGLMVGWVLLAGFGCGSSLVVALSLFALRARSHQQAGSLSGMAQSLGYLLAAAGPPLFGVLHGMTGGWKAPLAIILAASLAQVVAGAYVGRERFVEDRPATPSVRTAGPLGG